MARTKQTARISTQGKDPARFPDIPKSVLAAGRGQKKQTEAYVPQSDSSKRHMRRKWSKEQQKQENPDVKVVSGTKELLRKM